MKIHALIKITAAAVLLLLLPFPAFSSNAQASKIEILKPTIYPDTAENQKMINDLIDGASILTERIYSNYLGIAESSRSSRRNAGYSLSINYVFDPDQSVLQLTLKKKSTEDSKSFNIMGGIKNDTPLFLARSIFYL